MKQTLLRVLAIVAIGLVFLAACSGDETSRPSTPDVPSESVSDRESTVTGYDSSERPVGVGLPGGFERDRPSQRGDPYGRRDRLPGLGGVAGRLPASVRWGIRSRCRTARAWLISLVGPSFPASSIRTCISRATGSGLGHFLWQIEDARSTQDVLDGIRERSESVPVGEYIIVVGGYPTSAFRLPTLTELDAVAPDHPVYLQASFSGPSAVNSLAKAHLAANGLGTIATDGRIAVDNTSRTPRAIQTLRSEQTDADAERAAAEYMNWANSMGITTVIDMSSTGDVEMAYGLWESGDLTIRMRLRFGGLGTIDTTIQAVEAGFERVGEGDAMMRVIGVGEFSLGNFGDTSSDFAAGWSDIAARGRPLAQHSLRSAEHDAHISAFEEVNATTALAELHWSLDHANQLSSDHLSRLADLGVGVGVHNFAYYGSFGSGAPFRDIIDAGVTAGAGSDGRAVGPLNPWQGIHFMVTGRTISGSLVNDGQQISRLEALRLYTMGQRLDGTRRRPTRVDRSRQAGRSGHPQRGLPQRT